MTGQVLRVYVVDDDPAVRNSLRALLIAHRFEAIACPTAEDFLSRFDRDTPACVLLDLRMPGMGGLELQGLLLKHGITVPVIVLTGHGDVPVAVRAMKAGAIDFIEKPATEDQLLAAIAQAHHTLAERGIPSLKADEVARRLGRLTTREREVLDLLVQGLTNKSIAEELGISQRTVEIHRARIREKLEARGLADLIRMVR
jgi:RNA polymerase sigma factor (sigma-70 family)